MPLYQTDNYSNIQIKEQHLVDKYKPEQDKSSDIEQQPPFGEK